MIDSVLQSELRARFNPDGSPLRRYQLHLLEMLKEFDAICKRAGVDYWLSSGTVLGAVRHGGFIPWDDDIDVEMRREDYLRLVALFEETDRYAIQTHGNDPYYPWLFAKFRDKRGSIVETRQIDRNYKYRGPFIDIFVMEPTHIFTSCLAWQGSRAMFHLSKWAHRSFLIRWAYRVLHLCTDAVLWLIRHTTDRLPGKRFRFGYGNIFYKWSRPESSIFPIGGIEFEGHTFPAPRDCDAYLRHIYGDYRKIPNIDDIRPHLVRFSVD